jgi:hypothetical protein
MSLGWGSRSGCADCRRQFTPERRSFLRTEQQYFISSSRFCAAHRQASCEDFLISQTNAP